MSLEQDETRMAQSARLLDALPHPLLAVDPQGRVFAANVAAEDFFQMSRAQLLRRTLAQLAPFGSPLPALAAQAFADRAPVREYRIDIGSPRIGLERIVDAHAAPLVPDAAGVGGGAVVQLHERTIAEKMDRQLTHRGAARSVSALASMLAHEIKNPLSGIRGAAQLLETSVSEDDQSLTRLICEEADRIVALVDRMAHFADDRPMTRAPVNIHLALDRVIRLAEAGFAKHIRLLQKYDPSLPPALGDFDQIVQILLNLIKNAAEAIGPDATDGEIEVTTAFRPGMRLKANALGAATRLPLEICIRDNGPGVPDDISDYLFDPFVTTKANGTGLGLALVAKIVGDHGGIVEFDSHPRRTTFRVLLPMAVANDGRASPI